MHYTVIQRPAGAYVHLDATDAPIATEEQLLELVAVAWETGLTAFLLEPESLAPEFFDLKSGLAGAALQKLANYRLRLALVGSGRVGSRPTLSPRFRELLSETTPGGSFGVFETAAQAEAWLLAGG